MELKKVIIVVSQYNERLSKMQPWYSIKKLSNDFKANDINVEIINSINQIPYEFSGVVIKVWSLKDIFSKVKNNVNYRLFYLFTFPLYPLSKILDLKYSDIRKNFDPLKRIILASLIPKNIIKKNLNKAENIITISDRSYLYLKKNNIVSIQYFPFEYDNWGGVELLKNKNKSKKTIGYFGPPYSTRGFVQCLHFFKFIEENNLNYNIKLLTRMEREKLQSVQEKYINTLNIKNIEIVSGFFSRDILKKELLDIDFLLLPFKIVMSELPVVVLEALELGIPVITTLEGGVSLLAKNQKNILTIERLNSKEFKKVLSFIESNPKDDFNKIKININKINTNFLSHIKNYS